MDRNDIKIGSYWTLMETGREFRVAAITNETTYTWITYHDPYGNNPHEVYSCLYDSFLKRFTPNEF